jgi:hypothetical protein
MANPPPVITSLGGGDTATVTVVENTTAIIELTAVDLDAPDLVLQLHGADSREFFIFGVERGVGWLLFDTPGSTAPDFDAPTDSDHNNSYEVTFLVGESGPDLLEDEQDITVNVIESLTAPPQITSNGGASLTFIDIAENTTAVTTVTATDPDGPATEYAIVGGPDAAAFNIDSTTGVLEFVTPPDFEAPSDSEHDNFYWVVVRASDGTAYDEQLLQVRVIDVSGGAPVITSNGGGDNAAVAVAENSSAVTTVTATGGPGYAIIGGADAAAFNINSTTGVLAFLAAPDFEAPTDADANNSYEVVVRAAADGPLFDDQTITVNVTDLPGGPPVITSNGGGAAASVAVNENTTAVTIVVAATQPDSPTLAYSITGGADAALFEIDPASGVLSFVDPPDVEAPSDGGGDNGYEVTVRASVGVLFDEQALTVDVTGIPDGRPIIAAHLGDVLWQHDDRTLSTFTANIGALAAGSSLSGIGDFDRDGDSDILIRNADMTAEIWELDGSNHVATHSLPVVSDWWGILGVGDFDRDGDSDILLRHREGLAVLWEIEDNAYVVNHNQPLVSDSWRHVSGGDMPWQWNWWRVVGTGDFDGDGDSDILWRHQDDGPTVMWEMEHGAYVANHNLPRLSDTWEVGGTGDFDGDGDDDVLWRGDADQVATWEIENWAMTSHDLPDIPAMWQIQGTRDFDGDGDSDILWRDQDGAVVTWDMQAGALAGTTDHGVVATAWQIRGTGEFDLA